MVYYTFFGRKYNNDEVYRTFEKIHIDLDDFGHPMDEGRSFRSGGKFGLKDGIRLSYILAHENPIAIALLELIRKDEERSLILSIRHVEKDQKFPNLEALAKKYELEPKGTTEEKVRYHLNS